MAAALNITTADRIMFGSDYPLECKTAANIIESHRHGAPSALLERGQDRDPRQYRRRCFQSMNLFYVGAFAAFLAAGAPAENPPRRSEPPPSGQLNLKTNVNVPVILCIDDKPTGGGQPSGDAYAKAAANGFRSVLTLRAPKDGVDTLRERFMVEPTECAISIFQPPNPCRILSKSTNFSGSPATRPIIRC